VFNDNFSLPGVIWRLSWKNIENLLPLLSAVVVRLGGIFLIGSPVKTSRDCCNKFFIFSHSIKQSELIHIVSCVMNKPDAQCVT